MCCTSQCRIEQKIHGLQRWEHKTCDWEARIYCYAMRLVIKHWSGDSVPWHTPICPHGCREVNNLSLLCINFPFLRPAWFKKHSIICLFFCIFTLKFNFLHQVSTRAVKCRFSAVWLWCWQNVDYYPILGPATKRLCLKISAWPDMFTSSEPNSVSEKYMEFLSCSPFKCFKKICNIKSLLILQVEQLQYRVKAGAVGTWLLVTVFCQAL